MLSYFSLPGTLPLSIPSSVCTSPSPTPTESLFKCRPQMYPQVLDPAAKPRRQPHRLLLTMLRLGEAVERRERCKLNPFSLRPSRMQPPNPTSAAAAGILFPRSPAGDGAERNHPSSPARAPAAEAAAAAASALRLLPRRGWGELRGSQELAAGTSSGSASPAPSPRPHPCCGRGGLCRQLLVVMATANGEPPAKGEGRREK